MIDAAGVLDPEKALVVPSFERGAALLRAADGRLLRLSWDEPAAERRRALPPGRYELVAYRLIARKEEATWHVSASALRGVALELEAGSTHTLEIEPTITIEERVQRDGLQVAVTGKARAGLSIYQDGKRIPIRFRRLDAHGTVRGEGKLTYG